MVLKPGPFTGDTLNPSGKVPYKLSPKNTWGLLARSDSPCTDPGKSRLHKHGGYDHQTPTAVAGSCDSNVRGPAPKASSLRSDP